MPEKTETEVAGVTTEATNVVEENENNSTESTEAEEDSRRAKMRFRWFGTKVKYSFGDEFADEYNAFREYASDFSAMNDVYFSDEDRRNLKIMELQDSEEEITVEVVKKQYKKLVKKYHPDVNQNDSQAEEKFKLLGAAYKAILLKISK